MGKKIFSLFLVWRISLFAIAFLSTLFIPKFGARFPYYDLVLIPTNLPSWIWSFGNFDGVHYLRLATTGYQASQFSQAFFPLYPLLIKIYTINNLQLLTGLAISNLFFILALYVLYQLFKLDYNQKTSFSSIILLLLFPTSFYFGAVYSESLFLFLIVTSIFLYRSNKFLAAGLCAALASATRIFGLMLIPLFFIELYSQIKKGELKVKSEEFIKAVISLFLIPMGTILYMWYLKVNFQNPLYFLTSQPAFGAERNTKIILLPQVLFRYLKILLTVPATTSQFWVGVLELSFTLIPLFILIWAYKKIRFSYWIFTIGCLLLPTLTGTLSSMPRYALMSFLLLPFVSNQIRRYFNLVSFLLVILSAILLGFFVRGYWIA